MNEGFGKLEAPQRELKIQAKAACRKVQRDRVEPDRNRVGNEHG
jgi:hypothetical protein